MVSSISDPGDRIATDLASKSTTDNRIATRVISATNPDLLISFVFLSMAECESQSRFACGIHTNLAQLLASLEISSVCDKEQILPLWSSLQTHSYILDADFSDYGNGLAFKQTYTSLKLVYMACEKLMIFGLF